MRLIDADALKRNLIKDHLIDNDLPYFSAIEAIDNAPTIDDLSEYLDKLWKKAYERGKVERSQGHWIRQESPYGYANSYECSECGRVIWNDEGEEGLEDFPYCHCGCRMIEEEEDAGDNNNSDNMRNSGDDSLDQ